MNPRTALLLLSAAFLLVLFGVATITQRLPFMRSREAAALAWPQGAKAVPFAPQGVAAPKDGLTASELWGLYNLDTPGADARFKGKPVVVTGVVSDVRRDIGGGIVLRLVAGASFETVRATVVNHDFLPASTPTRGQTVSLRCVGRGSLIGSPLLDACAAI